MTAPDAIAQIEAKCLHGRGYLITNRRQMRLEPWQRCLDEDGEWWLTLSASCKTKKAQEDADWAEQWKHPTESLD